VVEQSYATPEQIAGAKVSSAYPDIRRGRQVYFAHLCRYAAHAILAYLISKVMMRLLNANGWDLYDRIFRC